VDLREAFMEEFAELSKRIQNNSVQGKIQMFFRLDERKEISKGDLAQALGISEGTLLNSMENFVLYGVVEEKGDIYLYKGYPPEFKDLVAMLPERKKKLQASANTLTQLTNEAEAQGESVDEYRRVIAEIKRDFGLE
jgi:DNA-binding transcriptional regulator GbsR (MarR family)